MRRLVSHAMTLLRDVRAAAAVEYCLILALVFLAMVGAVAQFAGGARELWTDISEKVSSAH